MCAVEGCSRPPRTRKWCTMHYERWLKTGQTGSAWKRGGAPRPPCSVADCAEPFYGRGLCRRHWHIDRRTKAGLPTDLPKMTAEEARRRRNELVAKWRADNPELARERRERAKDRRRARIAQVEYEAFGRLEIFERDGWTCQICECRVMRSRKHPDPLSASLDHIIPLAAGGGHTRANTQLAHLRCNLMKSDRVLESDVAA